MVDCDGTKFLGGGSVVDLFTVIKERRSIRKYRGDPVTDEAILTCLEAARLAPSWANTQVWRFVVIKEPATKRSVSEALPSNNPARQALLDAPVAVCLTAQRNLAGMKNRQG
jgi:nitroreductase